MIPLPMPHAGRHRRPPVRPPFFRRLLGALRRDGYGVPAGFPAAGALPASTGQLARVHPREHLGPERPTTLQRRDGQVVIDEYNHVEVYPWPAAERPGCPVPTEGWRADDTRCDLPLARPYAPANQETRELYHGGASREPAHREPPALNPLLAASAPVYGEAPQDTVDEAQRLAEVMQP